MLSTIRACPRERTARLWHALSVHSVHRLVRSNELDRRDPRLCENVYPRRSSRCFRISSVSRYNPGKARLRGTDPINYIEYHGVKQDSREHPYDNFVENIAELRRCESYRKSRFE